MPAIAIMLEGILEFSKHTSNIIWIGIFVFEIMLLILSLVRNKDIKTKDIIWSVIGFIIGIGFIIHFALQI